MISRKKVIGIMSVMNPTLSRSYHRGSKEWWQVAKEIAWGISCEAKFVRNGNTLNIILYAA